MKAAEILKKSEVEFMCKVLLYHLELRKTFLFFIGFRASSFAFLIHA